jgi:hypothetical protein
MRISHNTHETFLQGLNAQTNLAKQIHAGLSSMILKATNSTVGKRKLTIDWVKMMLRIRQFLGKFPFDWAERMQDANFMEIARSLHKLDNSYLKTSLLTDSGYHNYFGGENPQTCFLPSSQYFLKCAYKSLMATGEDIGLFDNQDPDAGVRSVGTIIFRAMHAHFIVYGAPMGRTLYLEFLVAIAEELDFEKKLYAGGLEGGPLLEMYNKHLAENPTSVRQNHQDHLVLHMIENGHNTRTRAKTLHTHHKD